MITPEQREERRKWVGASDVAAILGLDPFMSARDAWASKVYATDDKPSDAMKLGNALESGVLDLAEEYLGPLARGRRIERGRFAVNLDAETADNIPVDAKVSLRTDSDGMQKWGEAGTDKVPQWVTVQVHAQMMATGADHAFVAALLGGRGFVLYRIQKSNALANVIAKAVFDFWEDYVKTKTPPPDTGTTSLAVLESIRREPKSTIAIEAVPHAEWTTDDIIELADRICEQGDIVEHYQQATKIEGCAKKLKSSIRANVLTLMGAAEQLLLPDGRKVKYPEYTRESIDKELLRVQFPDAYAACTKTTTYRKLTVTKAPTQLQTCPEPDMGPYPDMPQREQSTSHSASSELWSICQIRPRCQFLDD